MSKCYVIKNKLADNFELNCCTIYPTKRDAELTISLHQLKNCEVVECTICEGDLEKELEVYKRALELACKEHKIFGYCAGVECMCDKTVLTCEECIFEDFLDQAREEIEKEKKDDN